MTQKCQEKNVAKFRRKYIAATKSKFKYLTEVLDNQ